MTTQPKHIQSPTFVDSIIENIPNMIFVKDAKDLRFVRFNKAGEELLGYSREEMLGKNDFDFFPKPQAEFFTKKDQLVLQGKIVVDIPEETITTKHGTKYLHTKKIPILDVKGNPAFLLGISEDITLRKAAEEQRFVLAQEKAANMAKTAFLANMSHEIRTPLSAMLGFIELMQDDRTLSPTNKDYLTTIARNGFQLLRIINEILDLSKVQASGISINKIGMSLSKVINDVIQLMTIQAQKKKLKIFLKTAATVPDRIVSDPDRLRQILINLVGNAIKFSNSGSINVIVGLTAIDSAPDKKLIDITVADTGIGISPEQEQSLFQPFAQADSSTTRKYGGTGLGLHLSKTLANALGGDLILKKSVLNQGSQFCLTIPAVPETAQVVHDRQTPRAEQKKTFRTNQRILVIDDSVDNRQLVKIMLAKFGITADLAAGGKAGLQSASEVNYLMIFLDIEMPEMDGFEVLKTLRARNYRGRVIALTAHAMDGYREYCLSQGFDDYLTKPIFNQALYECLLKNLNSANADVNPGSITH